MPTTPNEEQMDQLRADVLEVCLERTLSISEILAEYAIEQHVNAYGKALVENTIRALALSGLLFSRGIKRGVVYRTTVIGRVAIPEYRNRKYRKP